jgi:hypothetical protein
MAHEDERSRGTDDRTGEYGGDDGALESERAEITPGEDTGMTATPTGQPTKTGETQAEGKQDQDRATGEEHPA